MSPLGPTLRRANTWAPLYKWSRFLTLHTTHPPTFLLGHEIANTLPTRVVHIHRNSPRDNICCCAINKPTTRHIPFTRTGMVGWIAKEAAAIEECHESLIDRLFNFMASHHPRSGTTRLSRLPVQLNATAVMGSKERPP